MTARGERSNWEVAAGLWARLNGWSWPEIDRELRDRIMIAVMNKIGFQRCLDAWARVEGPGP